MVKTNILRKHILEMNEEPLELSKLARTISKQKYLQINQSKVFMKHKL